MGWLRKERDLIGLVVAWGILLQSIVLPFTTGLHAATLTSESVEASVLCTTRSAAAVPALPAQSHKTPDCQCCHMACRQGCGGMCGGILPSFARVILPSSTVVAVAEPSRDTPAPQSAWHTAAKPRAPPLA